jgi:glycosyltransferase involved in cell wall biosynthesis
MKSILFLSQVQPLAPFSGFAYRTCGILKWLVERYSVDVVFLGDQEEIKSTFIPLEQFGSVKAMSTKLSIMNRLMAIVGPLPYHHVINSPISLKKLVQQQLSSANYDLIWLNKTVQFPILESLKNLPPLLVDQHAEETSVWDNLINHDPRRHIRMYSKFNKFRDLSYTRKAYSRVAGVLAISERDFEVTRSLYPGTKLIYIPQGVDPNYYAPNIMQEQCPEILLFSGTGAIRNVQAVRHFVENIMPTIHRSHPNTRLCWIGNVELSRWAFLERPWIEVTGFVDHVPPYFNQGMIYVSPFDMGEGMKTKIIEALSMGKVVVATPTGISGLRIDSLPFIRVCENDDDFAEAVLEFMTLPQLCELGALARRYAMENFSWDHILAPLEPFIEEITRK